MPVKLYIGNLSYEITDARLRDAFAPFGTVVSAQVAIDKSSGESRGFGFVEMETQDEANTAIEGSNGKDLAGRNLVVNEAKPREERPAGNRGGGGYR